MTIQKKSLTLLSSFFIFLSAVAIASAQQPPRQTFDITVSPTFFDLSSKEENTINQTIKLRNNTTQEISLKAEVKKMGADTEGKLAIKDDDDGTLSWVEVKDPKIIIKPREWANLPFSIKVPKNAAFGYYWAISVTQDTPADLKTSGAKVNAAVVVPILLFVPKNGAKIQGELTNFSTDSFWYEYPPIKFLTSFSNTGNVHVKPRGNIFLKDWLGRTVGIIEVNPSQGTILPNIKRVFESEWKDAFITYEDKVENGEVIIDKNGKPKKELKIRFDKILDLRIGKYTANALLVVNGETRDIAYESSITFFVFPWKIIIGIAVFTLLAGVGLFSTTKSLLSRIRKLFGGRNKNV